MTRIKGRLQGNGPLSPRTIQNPRDGGTRILHPTTTTKSESYQKSFHHINMFATQISEAIWAFGINI